MHSKDDRRLAPSSGAEARFSRRVSTPVLAVCTALLFVASAAGCDGPSAPATIKGEPVCADFEVGASHTKMQGGLKQPVRMRVLEDGDTIATVTVNGLRTAQSQRTRFLLPDSNAEYDIEWAQCESQRATPPATNEASKKLGPSLVDSRYECGDAKVYATEKLVTKRGEGQTRSVTMPPPPNPACWENEVPPEAPAPSASPALPPLEAPPLEAPPVEAGASASAAAGDSVAPAASASAAAGASAAPAAKP